MFAYIKETKHPLTDTRPTKQSAK